MEKKKGRIMSLVDLQYPLRSPLHDNNAGGGGAGSGSTSNSFYSLPRDSAASAFRDSVDFGDSVDTFYAPPAERPKGVPLATKVNQYCHLALFAVVGCWMRIRLEVLTEENGLSSSSSAIFIDLVGNMIGCFVIGALATGSALDNIVERNLAIVPSSWQSIQENKELQLGARTGFCGSLTTFASWNHAMILLLLDGTASSIANGLFGYIIGFLLSFICVYLGEYFALLVVVYVCPPEGSRRKRGGRKASNNGSILSNDIHGLDGIRESASEEADKGSLETDRINSTASGAGGAAGGCCAGCSVHALHTSVFVLLTVVFCSLFALYLALPYMDDDQKAAWWCPTRTQGLALLFAPVGAFLRYEFSNHLNGRRKDFFVGTYCANLFACVLDSVAYGLRDGASNGSAEVTMVMSALGTGVGGCCSTVSTFMTDTIKLVPAQKRDLPKEAFSYVAITMSTCCAISMAIYQATKIHSS
jgi:CrcB protein